MLLTNPFHLLGLPADATAKERSERESRIRAYLEVGKPLEFGEQDVVLGAKRNAGNVQQALKSMQAADARMGSGFFWFTRSGMLDEQALGLLAEDKRDHCRELLDKLEGREPTSGYFSSIMNLGTFRMLEALLARDGAGFISGLTVKMKALGAVEEPVFLEWARSIGDEISSSDVDKVLSHFEPAFETVRKEADRYGLSVSSGDWSNALKAGGSRFGSMEEALALGPRAKVMDAISTCKSAREAEKVGVKAAAEAMLESVRIPLGELKEFLGSDHLVFGSLRDAIAKELLECAVVHWNRTQDDGKESETTILESLALVDAAKSLHPGEMVRSRAEEHAKKLLAMNGRFGCACCGLGQTDKTLYGVQQRMCGPLDAFSHRYSYVDLTLKMCIRCRSLHLLKVAAYAVFIWLPLCALGLSFFVLMLFFGRVLDTGILTKTIGWGNAVLDAVHSSGFQRNPRVIELKSEGWKFHKPKG